VAGEQRPLSLRNPHVQHLRRLLGRRRARQEAGEFAFEGPNLVAEALDVEFPLRAVYVDERAADGLEGLCSTARAAGVDVRLVAAGAIDKVADTVSPQGIIAVAPRPAVPIDTILQGHESPFVIVLDRVTEPGNAGTIVRTAEAVAAAAVVFTSGSTDAFGPKTVRASAGSSFRTPVVEGGATAEVLDRLRRRGMTTVGAAVAGGTDYRTGDLTGAVALVVGNEGGGLDASALAQVDRLVTVPMGGRVESLNVAVTTAVIGYERVRQTDAAGHDG
jgi:TrmH family RNA methyltransferase